MKRLLFSLVAVLFAITAIGQEGQSVTIDNVRYTVSWTYDPDHVVINPNILTAAAEAVNTNITSANILGTVTINGTQCYYRTRRF